MVYDLSNPYDKAQFDERCKTLIKEQATVELTKKSFRRSLAQNAYLHLLIGYFASEMGYTADEVKVDFFKRRCNKDIFERERNNRRGEVVRYLRSSAELTSAEMTTAIERFRNYSSSICGLYLPEPDDTHHIIHAYREIEKNKEYI